MQVYCVFDFHSANRALHWSQLPPLPDALGVAGPFAGVSGGALLAGGDDGSRAGFQPMEDRPGFPNTVLAYDVKAGNWRTNGDVPAARATVPTVFWHHRFVILSVKVLFSCANFSARRAHGFFIRKPGNQEFSKRILVSWFPYDYRLRLRLAVTPSCEIRPGVRSPEVWTFSTGDRP